MSTPYNLPDGVLIRDLEDDWHTIPDWNEREYEKELEKEEQKLDIERNDL